MNSVWLHLAWFNTTIALAALLLIRRSRRATSTFSWPSRSDDVARTTPAAGTPSAAAGSSRPSILLVGPTNGPRSGLTADARRAAESHHGAVVTSVATSAVSPETFEHAFDDVDLLMTTGHADESWPWLARAHELGVPCVLIGPLTDPQIDVDALIELVPDDAVAIETNLGPSPALQRALTNLIREDERIESAELEALILAGDPHYEAIDELTLTVGAVLGDADVQAWDLRTTVAEHRGQRGTITTSLRKIEWSYDGEVGTARADQSTTSEIETSIEVRIRIDPVHHLQRAIDTAFGTPTQQPYHLTATLLAARARWWGSA